MRHIIFDHRTGNTQIEGRSRRRYSQAEVDRAEHAARSGDAEAQAILADVDLPETGEVDWVQHFRDCPECRDAMEAGEVPVIRTSKDLFAAARRREHMFGRRPRWRHLKRRD
jgi:hypothetical protein